MGSPGWLSLVDLWTLVRPFGLEDHAMNLLIDGTDLSTWIAGSQAADRP